MSTKAVAAVPTRLRDMADYVDAWASGYSAAGERTERASARAYRTAAKMLKEALAVCGACEDTRTDYAGRPCACCSSEETP